MTIEKIQNSKIIAFRPKDAKQSSAPFETEATTTQVQDKAPSDPRYYQVINNINRQNHYIATVNENNVILLIPFENHDSITLELNEEDSSGLLFNRNDSLDDESVDFFVERFKSFYRIRKEKYEKEKAFLMTVLKESYNKDVICLDSRLNLEHALKKNISTSSEDYMEALFEDILDSETRYILANLYLKAIEEKFAKSTIITAKEAMEVLRQCKQKDNSLDKSNLAEKTKIAVITVNCNTDIDGWLID